MPEPTAPAPVPRGRHAPPLEIRLRQQRGRLFAAAAVVFARSGYADATAEAISREAGMSKATFYAHFANKEECILALFDESARQIAREMAALLAREYPSGEARLHAGVSSFLEAITRNPALAQTVLVESVGAGPRTMERRDAELERWAEWLYDDNVRNGPRYGAARFATRDDAFAVIGALFELVSRHLRTGQPAAAADLVPVVERVVRGMLAPPAP